MFFKKKEYASSMTIVDMCVHMDCEGCQKKIRKALMKLNGVDNIDIDMVRQKVTVTGYVDQKKVLKAVRKTGRTAVFWPYPHNIEYYDYAHEQHHHQQQQQQYPALEPYMYYYNHTSRSSYNYQKHGYSDSQMHGYYAMPQYSSAMDEKARALFSDDNPHACSIM